MQSPGKGILVAFSLLPAGMSPTAERKWQYTKLRSSMVRNKEVRLAHTHTHTSRVQIIHSTQVGIVARLKHDEEMHDMLVSDLVVPQLRIIAHQTRSARTSDHALSFHSWQHSGCFSTNGTS